MLSGRSAKWSASMLRAPLCGKAREIPSRSLCSLQARRASHEYSNERERERDQQVGKWLSITSTRATPLTDIRASNLQSRAHLLNANWNLNRPTRLDGRQQEEQHLAEIVPHPLLPDRPGRGWRHSNHQHIQSKLGPAHRPDVAGAEQEIAQHPPRTIDLLRP